MQAGAARRRSVCSPEQRHGSSCSRRPAVLLRAAVVPDEDRDREPEGQGDAGRPEAGCCGAACDSQQHCCRDERKAGETDEGHPAKPGVGSRAERVQERYWPGCVAEPVHQAPGAIADPRAEQARNDKRQQQVERNGSETKPERAVAREERDQSVDEPDWCIAVGDRRHDVHEDEHDREQRHIAVQAADEETREAIAAPAD